MQKALIILTMALLLSSCFNPVHKMDIEQGNIITADMVNRLHTGMSEEQVHNIMGNPVLLNTFKDNRVDYVYTFQTGHHPKSEKFITLIFKNGRLKEISGNMYSQYIK